MISFIIPLIYILFANATTVYITKKSFAKSLPLTLLLTPFPLFFSGLIFSSFKVGIIINFLYAIISIPLIIRDSKEFKKNYFTYGLIAFTIIYTFIFIYDLNRTFHSWDEASHWGLMLKEMFRLDNFYSINESTLLVHKDYPPILQLYELFWIKCCGVFKECYATRALHTFCISLLLPFLNLDETIEKINFKTINFYLLTYLKSIFIVFIALLTILLFDTHGILNTIYNDYPLSILMVYIILLIMYEKDKTSNFLLLNISILSTFILLTKQVSIAFYIMILFFYFINLIKNVKIDKLKILKIILLLIVIPLLTTLVWNKYIDQYEITKQFMVSDIKINELSSIVLNKNNEKHIIVERFKDAVFNQNISHIKYGSLTYFSSYLIYTLIVLISFFVFKEIKKKDWIKYYITMTIGYICYAIMMLILYLFCFKEEGFKLASFDRYMVTYLLIAFISLIIIILRHFKSKNVIICYIVTLIVLILSINNNVLYRVRPALKMQETHYLQDITDYIIKNTEENSKIFILSQTIPHVEIQIYTNYYINPRKTNFEYYNLPTDCDNCEEKYNIQEYLLDYDYFYIFESLESLDKKYPYLKNLKVNRLYKISSESNSIKFNEVINN